MTYRALTSGTRQRPGGYVPSHTFLRPGGGRYIVAEERAGRVPRGYEESLGAVTIPDYTLWTAAEVSAFYNVLLNAISQLNTDITRTLPASNPLRSEYGSFSESFLSTWRQYHAPWVGSTSSSAAVLAAREAAGRHNRFEERFRATGHEPTPPGIGPVGVEYREPRPFGLPIWQWALIGGGGLLLTTGIVYSLSKVAVAWSPAGVASAATRRNPRRRKRRRGRRRKLEGRRS